MQDLRNEADQRGLEITEIQSELPDISHGLVESYDTVLKMTDESKQKTEESLSALREMQADISRLDGALEKLQNELNNADSAMCRPESDRDSLETISQDLAKLEEWDFKDIRELITKILQSPLPQETKENSGLKERQQTLRDLEAKHNSMSDSLRKTLEEWDNFYVVFGDLKGKIQDLEGKLAPTSEETKPKKGKKKKKGKKEEHRGEEESPERQLENLAVSEILFLKYNFTP